MRLGWIIRLSWIEIIIQYRRKTMRTNLLETYSRQLNVAEAYVAKNFAGREVSNNTKLATAVLLDNTNRFINSRLEESVATSHADLGAWKKFCLNLTNIAVPSLIANDLVIVHPMTSISGSVAYLEYVATTDKNGMEGEVLNGAFGLGKMSDNRVAYTSQIIVENYTSGSVALTPVVGGIKHDVDGAIVANTYKCIKADGEVVFADTIVEGTKKVAYVSEEFQMEKVPSKDIPSIGPKMRRIPLVAEPRRIAVKYDQITAFEAKTDYGFSLDKQIAEQACGELAYEIDTEIVDMLYEGAKSNKALTSWNKRQPIGVSKFDHFAGFLEVIEEAKSLIYKATGKYHPNYMVVAANCMQVIRFVPGFTPVKNAKMNGPYKVGELDGLNVYVSPRLGDWEFFFGLNGNDMMSSAGVYAPYMAIIPTQLLGTPDGGLAQGFSTYYAKALLNKNLLVAGKIVDEDYTPGK